MYWDWTVRTSHTIVSHTIIGHLIPNWWEDVVYLIMHHESFINPMLSMNNLIFCIT